MLLVSPNFEFTVLLFRRYARILVPEVRKSMELFVMYWSVSLSFSCAGGMRGLPTMMVVSILTERPFQVPIMGYSLESMVVMDLVGGVVGGVVVVFDEAWTGDVFERFSLGTMGEEEAFGPAMLEGLMDCTGTLFFCSPSSNLMS